MNRREQGAYYENMAAEYLSRCGYRILARNFRCRLGEIDLVCRDGRYLVFVEVKFRSTARQGKAFMAVDSRKQHRISQVAAFYLTRYRLDESTPCRFDVVAIDGDEVTLIKNAFDYC